MFNNYAIFIGTKCRPFCLMNSPSSESTGAAIVFQRNGVGPRPSRSGLNYHDHYCYSHTRAHILVGGDVIISEGVHWLTQDQFHHLPQFLSRLHRHHPLDFSVSSSVGGCSKVLAKQLPSRIADFSFYPTCLLLTHCITLQPISNLAQWTVN